MPVPSGAVLTLLSQSNHANGTYALFRLSGTYVAANFSLGPADGLGFTPVKVKIDNLTDRISIEANSGLANGLLTVAAGTRTFVAHGLTFDERKLSIVPATNTIIGDNDTVLIEVIG